MDKNFFLKFWILLIFIKKKRHLINYSDQIVNKGELQSALVYIMNSLHSYNMKQIKILKKKWDTLTPTFEEYRFFFSNMIWNYIY